MNAYNDLTTLKDRMGMAGASVGDSYDTALTNLLIEASRFIDEKCLRVFYVFTGTRYFRGAGNKLFLPDDLLSITTLKTDEDGDGTFENTLTEDTDFVLQPPNWFPKTWAEILSQGSYGGFAAGRVRGVQIIGSFGYGDGKSATPYVLSGSLLTAEISASTTSIPVDTGTQFGVGQTLLIDSEQMYVSAISSNTLTCTRAVNGTTAAIHVDDSVVYIYQYPEPVEEAVLIRTMRMWKRKDSAFQNYVKSGGGEGVIDVYKDTDPSVASVIKSYKRKNSV